MIFRLLLVLSCFSISINISASVVDSLKTRILIEMDDSIRCLNYIDLSNHYLYTNFDSTKYYGELSIQFAKEKKLGIMEKEALLILGFNYYDKGKFLKAFSLFTQAVNLKRTPGDSLSIAHSINGLGLVNWKYNRIEEALKQFQEVHDLAKSLKDDDLLESALNNIGLLSLTQGRYDQAINYFNQSYNFAERTGNPYDLAIVYLNRGVTLTEQKKYKKAEEEFFKCLEIVLKDTDYGFIAECYNSLGDLYFDQKQYKKSLKYYNLSIKYCQDYDLQDILLRNFYSKAEVYLTQDNYATAIQNAKDGLKIANSIKYPYPELHELLGKAFEKGGNYQEAISEHRKFVSLKDSIEEKDKKDEFALLEISFQSKEKAIENASLIKEKKIQQSELKQKTLIIGIISIASAFLMAIAFMLSLYRKKDQKTKIYLEKEVKRRTEELNLINSQLIQSNAELKRFAYIASHDLKEPLRNISGFISLIKRRGDNLSKEDFQEYFGFIEKSNLQMADLINSILQYSKLDASKEAVKEPTDLSEILEDVKILLFSTIRERNIQFVYQDLPTISYYPYVIKTVLKNLIENGLKYNESDIPIIKISSHYEKEYLILKIADNGIGIDPQFHQKIFDMFARLNNRKAYTGSGMGLAFCRKLLMKYEGSIDISKDTREGNGSTFIVKIKTELVDAVSKNVELT